MKRSIFAVLLLTAAVWAGPREEIARAYFRSSQAMSLKFVDGVHSLRGRNYELIDPESVKVTESIERSRLESFLARALEVEETSVIKKFELSGETAHCLVHYHTRLRLVDEKLRKPYDLILDTDCQDLWKRERTGWKIQQNRVLRQDARKVPL